jgi:hypothetical protein
VQARHLQLMPVILATQERDPEDWGSKPAWANSLWDTIVKKPFTKKSGGVAQGVHPKFKPQYRKKNAVKRRKVIILEVKFELNVNWDKD